MFPDWQKICPCAYFEYPMRATIHMMMLFGLFAIRIVTWSKDILTTTNTIIQEVIIIIRGEVFNLQ